MRRIHLKIQSHFSTALGGLLKTLSSVFKASRKLRNTMQTIAAAAPLGKMPGPLSWGLNHHNPADWLEVSAHPLVISPCDMKISRGNHRIRQMMKITVSISMRDEQRGYSPGFRRGPKVRSPNCKFPLPQSFICHSGSTDLKLVAVNPPIKSCHCKFKGHAKEACTNKL